MTSNIKRATTITKKQLELRNSLWPDLNEQRLWNRKRNQGFTTIPRTMPLIQKIMNEISKNKPVGNTYLDLWCLSWDHSFVTITSQDTRAFYAGFSGQRAVDTWKDRMRRLVELGFIDVQEGPSGPFNYVLIYNPHLVIFELFNRQDQVDILLSSHNALLQRLNEIGEEIPAVV